MSALDFTKDLKSMIRTNTEHDLADATVLAKKTLSHVGSELARDTRTFSVELFVVATLHVVYTHRNPSLTGVLKCIVDPKLGTERKMLLAISKISQFTASKKKWSYYEAFNKKIVSMSDGTAERKVLRSYAQWRKAFNLPEKVTLVRKIRTAMDCPVRDSIRIDTRYELADAIALAAAVLNPVKDGVDSITFNFARGIFVAAALDIARNTRQPTMQEMLNYLVDPNWDSHKQIINSFGNGSGASQEKTKRWITSWYQKVKGLSDQRTRYLMDRSCALWVRAFKEISEGKPSAKSTKPLALQSGIQVFNLDAIGKAMQLTDSVGEGKKAFGEKMLQLASENNGYRTVPDARKAGLILEKAKRNFENLVEPISHLQTNLALAAAMDEKNFRVTPILLLGDPGIGKTYLAMELAKGLGGSVEKLSAGGAQGGFQITGSHSSLMSARPGSLFRCLAESKTTSPVLVIDEVDKIVDAQWPVTPVLLDLFEQDTAQVFRDEFFEMEFDASRIIVILTANSIKDVAPPLLSRVEVFEVPRPEPEQRLRIINDTARQLRADTGRQIRLDKDTSQQLADRKDIDLRKSTRIVREAFTKAMLANETVAKLIMPKNDNESRRSMGFY